MATIAELIIAEAQAQGLDPRLALEVAIRESGLDQGARGGAGEIGVFQLLPDTAAALGVDAYDLQGNIAGGVRYLQAQLLRFGDTAAALAAYNWGPQRVAEAIGRYGAAWLDHLPASTGAYVEAILANLATRYAAGFDPGAAIQDRLSTMDWKPVLLAVGIGFAVLIGVRLLSRSLEYA
jgi:soluble lytic murein transglycosylase-like protein